MDWSHRTFRRLYQDSGPAWRLLPSSTRGLAALLILAADDDGCIPIPPPQTPEAVVARLIDAHPGERARLASDLSRLLSDTFLLASRDPSGARVDAIRIRNFHAAQGVVPMSAQERSDHRSNDAIRQARRRAKAKEKKDAAALEAVDRDASRDSNRDASRDSHGVTDQRDTCRDDPASRARAQTGAGTGTPDLPLVPSVSQESKKKPAGVREPTDPILSLLEASPELAEAGVDLSRLAGKLRADTIPGGWSDKRIAECLPYTLDALSLSRDPSESPIAFVVKVMRRVAKPGQLEAEMAKTKPKTAPAPPADHLVGDQDY